MSQYCYFHSTLDCGKDYWFCKISNLSSNQCRYLIHFKLLVHQKYTYVHILGMLYKYRINELIKRYYRNLRRSIFEENFFIMKMKCIQIKGLTGTWLDLLQLQIQMNFRWLLLLVNWKKKVEVVFITPLWSAIWHVFK